MSLTKRFGTLLAAQRKRIGVTQEHLASLSAVSVDMISRLETGKSGAKFATVEKLAGALRVDPGVLFIADAMQVHDKRSAFLDITAKLARLSDDWYGSANSSTLRLSISRGVCALPKSRK